MPIHSSKLRTRIDGTGTSNDGKIKETCPGCNTVTHILDHNEKKQVVPPYICLECKRLGWRARGNWAYEPGEEMITSPESEII